MNEYQLSKRLETAASYVPEGARLADIGSDHAYLPCYLAQKDKIEFAIAGEVAMGPFSSAKNQIAQSRLEQVVEARLGDGLSVVAQEDAIDTVTICGMGGDLIARILEGGKQEDRLKEISRYILQPNNAEYKIRKWLLENGCHIVAEEIIEENSKIYEIIVAEPAENLPFYTKEDYLFGKFLRKEKSPIFIKKWQREIQKNQAILARFKHSHRDLADKKTAIMERINQIKEVIT